MNPFEQKSMVDYWKTIIREKRDAFRTYVCDPALFSRIDKLKTHLRVLDCGCGEGYVSRYIANNGHEVTGIDSSDEMIAAAKELHTGQESYQKADLQNLPFADQSFDCVVSNLVLMELETPEKAISEISRVLKKNGVFIFQILHPLAFTSNSGQRVSKSVQNYFEPKRFSEKFVVDGLESPSASIRFHHPLSGYTHSLELNGFIITSLEEPTPISSTPAKHPIRELFKEPWMLLIQAEKVI